MQTHYLIEGKEKTNRLNSNKNRYTLFIYNCFYSVIDEILLALKEDILFYQTYYSMA